MQYDFEHYVDRRHTTSYKWNAMTNACPNVPEGVIPLSVADMELKNPPEIMAGLRAMLDPEKLILGYAGAPQSFRDAVCSFMKKRHNWNIEPEWIVPTAGVVPAFYNAVLAYTRPGEGIIVMPPVYYPFFGAAEQEGRNAVYCPLLDRGNRYEIDFDLLEQCAQSPDNRVLLFCSPHNPVGRVWTVEELKKVGEICLKNDVLMISDEIHFDLIMPGYRHTVYATINDDFAQNSVICTAPSKTFNLAGMQTSSIIIPNAKLREAFAKTLHSGRASSPTILGYKACEIAYTECLDWLNQLIVLIDRNRQYVEDFCDKHLTRVRPYTMEGTYLQWLDLRAFGMDGKTQEQFLRQEGNLFTNGGYMFGQGGEGFERLNLACPTSCIEDAMNRLQGALAILHEDDN